MTVIFNSPTLPFCWLCLVFRTTVSLLLYRTYPLTTSCCLCFQEYGLSTLSSPVPLFHPPTFISGLSSVSPFWNPSFPLTPTSVFPPIQLCLCVLLTLLCYKKGGRCLSRSGRWWSSRWGQSSARAASLINASLHLVKIWCLNVMHFHLTHHILLVL